MELTPDFSISINGGENFPKDRVLSIRTTDEAGIVSDSCEIELDDFDNALQFPNTEAKVIIFLGYKETELTKIGTYFVREISIDGARHVVKIQGNAAPKSMRSQKTRSSENPLSAFAQETAEDNGLELAIADDFEDIDLTDAPQFAESDMNYITRMSQKIGAVAKTVDGHLVVAHDNTGQSVSGQALPTKYLDASDVVSYACNFKETESDGVTGTVYANWYDKNTGEYNLVHAGSGAPETELNEIFATKEQAEAAVRAKFKRITKLNKTLRFSVEGRPDLFAESPLVLRGFPSKIPTNWIISRVEHSLSSSGFSTNVDCVGGN